MMVHVMSEAIVAVQAPWSRVSTAARVVNRLQCKLRDLVKKGVYTTVVLSCCRRVADTGRRWTRRLAHPLD